MQIQKPLSGNKITIQNLNEKYGLVKKRVNCMFQDSKGFVWFGMVNGLYKFDQYSFAFLSSKRYGVNGFPEADISAIIEIKPGLLFIGTHDKGLLVYDSESMRSYSVYCDSSVDFTKLNVKCLLLDKSGIIWIGTYKGLYRIKYIGKDLERQKVQLIPDNSLAGLADYDFVSIKESESGVIWLATMGDIGYYNPVTKKIKLIYLYQAISSFEFIDRERILIGCYGSGLKVLNSETYTLKNLNLNSISEKSFIQYLYKDKDSNIWLSVSNEGLYFLGTDIEKPTIMHFSNRETQYSDLNSNVILQINETSDGTLWICTEDGINTIILKKNYFQSYSSNNSEQNLSPSLGIRSLLDSKKGFIWAGTIGGGLKQFNLTTKKFENVILLKDGKKIGNIIQTMMLDNSGNLWLGTGGEGVIKFRPDKNVKYLSGTTLNYRAFPQSFPAKTLLNDFIMCFLEDSHSNIWIGTWYGLSLIDSSEVAKTDPSQIVIKNFLNNPTDSNSISNNTIMSLLEDQKGNIWVGTQAGLNKVIKRADGYIFSHCYKNKDGNLLTEKKILCLYQSKRGKFWFSTQEGGIFFFNPDKGTFEEFNSDNGFFENIITSITEDSNGNLWLGSNNGLCSLNQNTNSYKIYTTEDGLISNDFLFAANCKIGNNIYFGVNNGLTVFNPNNVVYQSFKPNLVFTDFRLFNKHVLVDTKNSPLKHNISNEKEITLKYNQNFITIFFASLNHKQLNEINYSCILEGLETSWSYLNKENRVTYTNLSPGNYIFRVKAYSSNDHTNVSEIFLRIVINPPYWKTTWAYVLYLFIILLVLIQTYKFFINREKRRNTLSLERLNAKRIHEMDLMKLQFFTNISHEFRTPLTLLSAPLDALIKDKPEPDKVQSYYQLMLRNVQRLKRLIDQLLDLRKIEEGHLKMVWQPGDIIEFIRKTFNNFQNYAEKRNIYFTFHSKSQELYTYFDSDKLDKVLFNLFSNAFKYTADYGSVSVKIEEKKAEAIPFENISGKYLEIKLTDSGIGIPEEYIDQLFKPFQQVDVNKPIGSNATGIGLSLTKELINLHNGFISVESVVDKGSTFVIYLPVYENNPDGNIKSTNNIANSENYNDTEFFETTEPKENGNEKSTVIRPLILIVEDNSDMRSFLREELRGNFRIIESSNGKQGLDQATEKIPDLIVSDVMMEKMDGIELCRQLKGDERTSHIPVILLTARHADDVKLSGYETGADDYITKPFSTTLLNSRIKNLIDQRRKLRKLFEKGNNFDLPTITANKIDAQFLAKLNSFIEKNIDNSEYDPVMLSSDMCMSKMQLYRKIAALTNQTVYNYIRTIRLQKAARLLLTTDMQISEISSAVGYTEPSNFTKSFTKQFNQTPSQFLRANRSTGDVKN